MKLVPTLAATALAVATLTACGGHGKHAADQPTGPVSLSPSATGSSSPSTPVKKPPKSPVVTASGGVNTIDPCQLVPQQEASTLAGASFGQGKEEGNKVRHACIYGAETANVLSVYVLQAASPAQAQAGWDQLLAEAQQGAGQAAQYIKLSPGSGIGDRSEWAELDLSQIGVQARGLAFLSGATGVYVIDLVKGGAAPSRDAFTNVAQTVLSRL